MLVIRFLRVGKRNQPSFQIVVTEKERGPKSGRFIEKVGFYNPLTKERGVNAERVKYWLSVGAKPSDTVWNLLVSEKVVEGKKIPLHARSAAKAAEETKVVEEPKNPEEVKPKEAKPEKVGPEAVKVEKEKPEEAKTPEAGSQGP